jgi:phosphoribosyl 1,2-cyclic phosphate phosphodiesterase
MGTGTSHGVPVIGCGCPTCTSTNPKNSRTRCSVVLGLPEGNLLIDTPPEMRSQFIREGVGLVHAVAFTHAHADHLFGLDDLRIFADYLGHDLPIHCEPSVERRIREVLSYAFDAEAQKYPGGGIPRLAFHPIDERPFPVLGASITPIPLRHGRHRVLGFRVGNVAYCTDTNQIPPESMKLLGGLDVLILDGLRHRPHSTHFALDEAVAVARSLGPRKTYFTHMCHDLEHESTNAALPPDMELAYDGLSFPLTRLVEAQDNETILSAMRVDPTNHQRELGSLAVSERQYREIGARRAMLLELGQYHNDGVGRLLIERGQAFVRIGAASNLQKDKIHEPK